MTSTKVITRTAISIALGTFLSMIKIFHLLFGGSVTLCSTLFFALPGFWFGPAVGIVSGVIAGLIDFVFEPVLLHPFQFFLDYILAFGCLGLAGIFQQKKKSLIAGYLFAVVCKFVCNFISGILFFKSYIPEDFSVALYSFLYNFSYTAIESFLAVVLVSVPAFKNVFESSIDIKKK